MKRALITGITGQDGSYLSELLIEKGYEVHGIIRRSSSFNTNRITHLYEDPSILGERLFLHYGDMTESSSLNRLLKQIKPHEVYNLAAQSHVRVSFDIPEYTIDVGGLGTVRLLDAIRDTGIDTKFYQASSSELYGNATEIPQDELTPFSPRSPYACGKLLAYWATVNYREAYGIHASNGILFNHESPRRGETFVTRKITRAVARILAGKQKILYLGNLSAMRDWGYAKDYVDAMWRMTQTAKPGDYVIATGEMHAVREFLAEAFSLVGLSWADFVQHDHRYDRPTEVNTLLGDSRKARERLGWKPTVTFKELVKIMVIEDLRQEGLDPIAWIKTL